MLVLSGPDAFRQINENVRKNFVSIPGKNDLSQYVDGGIFPKIEAPFRIELRNKVFTIGSCFAREVESVLVDAGFDVPVSRFQIPEGELPFSGPNLLNEYNAGTIVQRIEALAGDFDHTGKGIEATEKGFIDLFLHTGSKPVSMERLQQRRAEIDALYSEIRSADVFVITLGLVESWFDARDGCYLNRAPSRASVRAEPDRFQFHRMNLEDVYSRVRRAIKTVLDLGPQKVILTVSPVPLEATFMPDSCVVANSYSKAVLRVCAEQISKEFTQVAYFPSFEIVNSFGTGGYLEDNVHVQPWVVHHIMHYLLTNFLEAPAE